MSYLRFATLLALLAGCVDTPTEPTAAPKYPMNLVYDHNVLGSDSLFADVDGGRKVHLPVFQVVHYDSLALGYHTVHLFTNFATPGERVALYSPDSGRFEVKAPGAAYRWK